ncbi:MAG TPA: alpha/beta hydrolase [Pseudonocardiaceae bacterium]|jgi:acetyl esterase/lipase|nr:alpha/beta hydrolase [Pseudonocardiaceae bacterium]
MSVQQPTRTISYGPDPLQSGDLYLPPGAGPFPVVVLIHGGNWTAPDDRTQLAALAEDLRAKGYAVWNIDYRTVDTPGGGWPGTFADIAAALDVVADLDRALDWRNVITVGHSAGGQLAVWAASRPDLPKQAPGFAPKVLPVAAVSIAGILDLVAADADRIGVSGLLGGHAAEYPERYAWTSPTMLSSGAVAVLAVHGTDDDAVPIRYGRNYSGAARARHEPVDFRELPGLHHTDLLDPVHPGWSEITDWLADRFRPNPGSPTRSAAPRSTRSPHR